MRISSLANRLIRWIGGLRVCVDSQCCTLRSGTASTRCFNGVGVRIAENGTGDGQRTGVRATSDRNPSTQVAVIQNCRALLPHKRDRAWATGRGRSCSLTFTNNLVCRIGCGISVDGHVGCDCLIVTCDIDTWQVRLTRLP